METLLSFLRYSFRSALTALLAALVLASSAPVDARDPDIRQFTSDGCSLFPDGTLTDINLWCDCCLEHDIAYWRGGTADERKKADKALHDCVLERTTDKGLAGTMYKAVRAGGHPVFPTWYRWAYGWDYGRGYKPLTEAESRLVQQRLDQYRQKHPEGYCGKNSGTSAATTAAGDRPGTWGLPIFSKHLENFHKIDDKVYRSAQPDKEGFRELKALGIRNILSLRNYHSDDHGKEFGLNVYRVEMSAGDIETGQVVEALRFIRNAEGPVLIHCWHGSDRTGLVSAMYRVVFQGWSKEDAIDELKNGGYGYHWLYRNIPEFIMRADIEEIKAQVLAQEQEKARVPASRQPPSLRAATRWPLYSFMHVGKFTLLMTNFCQCRCSPLPHFAFLTLIEQ